jgi:hypothetical protein
MKRFVLALALTGLMSVTVLAGNVPINGVVGGGDIPTTGAASTTPTTSTASTYSSTLLVTVIVTVLGLR